MHPPIYSDSQPTPLQFRDCVDVVVLQFSCAYDVRATITIAGITACSGLDAIMFLTTMYR